MFALGIFNADIVGIPKKNSFQTASISPRKVEVKNSETEVIRWTERLKVLPEPASPEI